MGASSQVAGFLKGNASAITTPLSSNADLVNLLNTAPHSSGTDVGPKAYLHVLFFDERFEFDKDASFVFSITYSPNLKASIDKRFSNAIEAKKSGYAYIYFSNESNEMVYFDNFMLTHERGRILEETHYYPFGLTMAGISSKALRGNYAENRKKFNGIEHTTDLDLNTYDAFYRNLDPQIGRFWQIDPKIESAEGWSPYFAMLDNPMRFCDPLGDSAIKPRPVQGSFVTLGQPTFNTNDPDYILQVKKALEINKSIAANGDPLLSFTGAVTWGSVGVEATIGEIGFTAVSKLDERDLIGLRDNKFVFNGKDQTGKTTYKIGAGFTLGGFGGEATVEASKTSLFRKSNIPKPELLTTKTSAPFVSRVTKTKFESSSSKVVYSGTEVGVSFKLGLLLGVEGSVNLNLGDYIYIAPERKLNPSESTSIKIYVPEIKR